MERLTFTVEVNSGDRETDRAYLQQVRDTFRMITEGLASFGFTGDETLSRSEINTTGAGDNAVVDIIDKHFPSNGSKDAATAAH